jgi:mono/diheme cytochrome c family protein
VRLQFVLSMGPLTSRAADQAIDRILYDSAGNFVLHDAALSGMRGHELTFLKRVLADPAWASSAAGRADVITDFSRAIINSGDAAMVGGLLDLMAAQPASQSWRQLAMLEAFPELEANRRRGAAVKHVMLEQPPAALAKLAAAPSDAVRARLEKVEAVLTWPGKPAPAEPKVEPLTPEQQARFELGKQQYATICGQCHKPDGMGQVGLAPPLVNSEWVLGPDTRLARIVLHGLRGPVMIGGKSYNMDMPSLGVLDDEKIAAALTYIRREWGHTAAPVEPKTIKDIRGATQGRKEAWSATELQAVR